MPNQFDADIVVVTIDGSVFSASLQSWTNTSGARPSSAVVLLYYVSARGFNFETYRAKTAVLAIEGTTVLTGHVYGFDTDSEDQVFLTILDKRQLLNKEYGGRRHLTTSGIRVLGQDIVFNLGGKPNKNLLTGIYLTTPVTPAFVYDKGNVSDAEDCATTESTMWTIGDILDFVWTYYIDDISKPTIPSYGGLDREAGEVVFFGRQVGNFIDELLSQTRVGWAVDGNGTAYFFDRATPRASVTLQVVADGASLPSSSYTLDYPNRWRVRGDVSTSFDKLDILGGPQIRMISAGGASDFYALEEVYEIDPVSAPDPLPVGGLNSIIVLTWKNHSRELRYRSRFDHSRYSTHGAGKDIRRKDPAKPVVSDLMIGRNKDGDFIDIESECVKSVVGLQEGISYQYSAGGAQIDPDLCAISHALNAKPDRWVIPIQTEVREFVRASGTQLQPSNFYLPIVRSDVVHKTREAIKVVLPITLVWTWDTTVSPNTSVWTITIECSYPSDWVLDFDTSFSGVVTDPDAVPPFDFTATAPAGTVVDGIGPLTDLKTYAEAEMGRVPVTFEGEFPSWRSLEIGSKLTVTGATIGLTGNEIVMGTVFDGETQSLAFVASSYVGSSAQDLARTFVSQRRFRTAGA